MVSEEIVNAILSLAPEVAKYVRDLKKAGTDELTLLLLVEQVKETRQMGSSLAEVQKTLGETQRTLGDVSKGLGEASKTLGEVLRALGDVSKGLGEALRALGEISKTLGEVLKRLELIHVDIVRGNADLRELIIKAYSR